MASLNQVLLIGNLTRDPKLKFTPSQTAVAEFGVATNRKFKTASGEVKEEVTFIDCAAFGVTAETINKHLGKGDPIFIDGRLKFDSWDDKQTGNKRSKLSVIVERFGFLPRSNGGAPRESMAEQADAAAAARKGVDFSKRTKSADAPSINEPPTNYSDEQQFKDDDIPF